MFENIKKLNELKKEAKNAERIITDKDGNQIIKMTVNDDSQFLSPYYADESIVSSEVADFLEHHTRIRDKGKDVVVIVQSDCIDDNEKVEYSKGIRNYYRSKFLDVTQEMKEQFVIAIIMATIGLLTFALAIILNYLNISSIVLEVIDIVGWVFMWETIDLLLLQRKVLKISQMKFCKLFNARVEFVSKESE